MSSLHSDNPRFRHLSEGEIKAIAEDDKAGMSKAAIARKYGISRPSVYRAIERGRGLTKRPPRPNRHSSQPDGCCREED
ncbi:helix-turn-helix domain-containing protein, partial [Paracoccus sp. (in: a-proteobacteria)]|uniref:helix-turn-helix domain-containing protein n=1 Tax=Paracoccus sp. TaxID=267 RepID=UPI0028AE2D2F